MDFNAASSSNDAFAYSSLFSMDRDSRSFQDSQHSPSSDRSAPTSVHSSPTPVSDSDVPRAPANDEPLPPNVDLDKIFPCLKSDLYRERISDAQEPPATPSRPAYSRSQSEAARNYSRVRIPRPPNAFMLFRSDFLKQKIIPREVERRQQNLSRIAGECWNLLPSEEKKKWQDQAAHALAEHQAKYPAYRFTPSPRGGSKKNKGRSYDADDEDEKDRIRKLRERYMPHMSGPAVPPARKRKPPTLRGPRYDRRERQEVSLYESLNIPFPMPVSTMSSPAPTRPPSASSFEAPLWSPSFLAGCYAAPNDGKSPFIMPGQQTPVTSRSPSSLVLGSTPPPSATDVPELDADLEITPTATDFGDISMADDAGQYWSTEYINSLSPPQYVSTALNLDQLRMQPDSHLNHSAFNSWGVDTTLTKMADSPPHEANGSMLGSLYSDSMAPYCLAPARSPAEGASVDRDFVTTPDSTSLMDGWDQFHLASRTGSPISSANTPQ